MRFGIETYQQGCIGIQGAWLPLGKLVGEDLEYEITVLGFLEPDEYCSVLMAYFFIGSMLAA
jgi:hypothetical protein